MLLNVSYVLGYMHTVVYMYLLYIRILGNGVVSNIGTWKSINFVLLIILFLYLVREHLG